MDRVDLHRRFTAIDHDAALRQALGQPDDFPNCALPVELGLGDVPLEYAIYWSPLGFIADLIGLGADVNYEDPAGFPCLIAALSTDRADRNALLLLLLAQGADIHQRGINDWTPLHYAVSQRDLRAVELLLAHDADPTLATRIDDYTTPIEDAEALGFSEAAALMREAVAANAGTVGRYEP